MKQAKEALKKYFGYDSFRPMQEDIINAIMSGKDALVIMPTGGGKSLCYQLPAVLLNGLTVVISPLIALMKDQVEALKVNGIAAEFLNSSQEFSEQMEITDRLDRGQIKLLYVSPERLLTGNMLQYLKQLPVKLFAIDEAHCISMWGHDFRPEYTKLKSLKKHFPEIPLIALTATADKITRKDIANQLELIEQEIFIASFDRPNLSLTVLPGKDRFSVISDFIKHRKNQAGIIYCMSRKSTEALSEKLREEGRKAIHYHAGLTSEERNHAQELFLNDQVQVMCATIAFGMGIDKSNVRWIIHYNLPKNLESYYQEIGRAGRDGLKSDTLLFYSFQDVVMLKSFAEESGQKEIMLAKLDRMQQYAESQTCRRKILLSYFNEYLEENCGNCDICQNPPECFDGTILTQKALSAVQRLQEKVATGMLIDVLRGSSKQELINNGYHLIKTYGAGVDVSYGDWQQFILQMLHHGIFEIAYDEALALKITDIGIEVLFKGKKVHLIRPVIYKKEEKKPVYKAIDKKEKLVDGLFETLRKVRKDLAQMRRVPPYVIFSDASLKEMAEQRPSNLEEMAEIPGVGEYKLEHYGTIFLRAIEQFSKDQDNKGSAYEQTFDMLKQGLSVDQISSNRNLNPITVYSHIAYLYDKDEDIDLEDFVEKQDIERICKAIDILGINKGLKPIYDYFKGKMDYYKIRLAISYYNKIEK